MEAALKSMVWQTPEGHSSQCDSNNDTSITESSFKTRYNLMELEANPSEQTVLLFGKYYSYFCIALRGRCQLLVPSILYTKGSKDKVSPQSMCRDGAGSPRQSKALARTCPSTK